MSNITLKVTALLCAIILWFYVVLQKEYSIEVSVPFVASGLASNLALKDNLPDSISLIIKGKGIHLIQEREISGEFHLNLSQLPLGSSKLNLLGSFYQAQFEGVEGASVIGDPFITVELDTKIHQKFAVKALLNINTSPGYTTYGDLSLSPDSIVLSGSRRLIRRLRTIQTHAIFLDNIKTSIDMDIPINIDFGGSISSSHAMVRATLKVDTLIAKSFPQVPLNLIRADTSSHYRLEPQNAKVTVTGAKHILDSIISTDIQLFIDYNRFKIENTSELAPNVKLQKEVKSWQVEPATFELSKVKSTMENKSQSGDHSKKLATQIDSPNNAKDQP